MTTLRELLEEIADAGTAGLAPRVDAAQSAVRAARRRRRRRVVAGALTAVVVAVIGVALLPTSWVARPAPVPPAVTPGDERLPAHLNAPPRWLPEVTVAPTGRVGLVASDDGGAYAVSADGTTQARLPDSRGATASSLSVSADGNLVAWATASDSCSGAGARVVLYTGVTGRLTSVDLSRSGGSGWVVGVAVAPTGDHVLVDVADQVADPNGCVATQRFVLVDPATGAATDLPAPDGFDVLAWDPDGRHVLLAVDDGSFVGDGNSAVRIDLAGTVVERFALTRLPDNVPITIASETGPTLRWASGRSASADVVVGSVATVADRTNTATSYDTTFPSYGNVTVAGDRDSGDVLLMRPVNGPTTLPDGARVVRVAAGDAPEVLVTADAAVDVIAVPAEVAARATLGGPSPAVPDGWRTPAAWRAALLDNLGTIVIVVVVVGIIAGVVRLFSPRRRHGPDGG